MTEEERRNDSGRRGQRDRRENGLGMISNFANHSGIERRIHSDRRANSDRRDSES
ncbi:MAG: hypothetical protein ACI9ZT_000273 [Gammaproteobacteria bacterium]|jgi:hypothetical protein